MLLIRLAFWICLIVVFYSYAGYGIVLWFLVKIKRAFSRSYSIQTNDYEPPVTLVVAAYNEEAFIEKKIQNTLELDYPTQKLQLIFITDGSADRTVELIRKHIGIELLHNQERKGKVAAMHRAMAFVKNPIVIFCDANTLLNSSSIREIAKHYSNPEVGGVAGEKKILQSDETNVAGAGEGLYWKYESFLKKLDAEFYTVVGAAGELFSVRTDLFENVGDDIILDDFVISLKVCEKGYRIMYEPAAYAMETPSSSIVDEQKRKIRISAGGFQAIFRLRKILNIFKFPKLAFQYISHRVLRWTVCPPFLILLFLSNLLILLLDGSTFYKVFFWLQVLFYLVAFSNWILIKNNIRIKAFYVPYYFVFMNVSVIQGFFRYIKGRQTVLWEKANRAEMKAEHSST